MSAASDFDDAVLGLGLPAAVQVALKEAGALNLPPVWRNVPKQALPGDPDWMVRWQAAGRAEGRALVRLLADAEPEVRERAAERRAELEASHG